MKKQQNNIGKYVAGYNKGIINPSNSHAGLWFFGIGLTALFLSSIFN